MAVFAINGHAYNPSVFEVGIQDVSSPEAGRDLSGTMHPMKITTKFTLKVEFWEIKPAEARQLLQDMSTMKKVNGVWVSYPKNSFAVAFWNPFTGTTDTKYFYVGDRSLPVRMWRTSGGNLTQRAWYAKLSFNLIEI